MLEIEHERPHGEIDSILRAAQRNQAEHGGKSAPACMCRSDNASQ